jgi:hypothetical protein
MGIRSNLSPSIALSGLCLPAVTDRLKAIEIIQPRSLLTIADTRRP